MSRLTVKIVSAQNKSRFRYLANSQPHTTMEATFVVKKEELTPDWLEQFKSQFAEDGTITITATGPEKLLSVEEQRAVAQREMFKRLQAMQTQYPPKTIDADVDINKLIDEMYWQGNH